MSENVPDTNSVGPRLLVVDDNEDNRYTLMLLLENEGYQNITVASDGEEALELLRAHEFDLVLLDVMMPKVDGYQVLERLKAEGRLHNIPIIMVSALNHMDSVIRCIGLGAVDYLPKPFDPVLLKARIGASLENKRLRDVVKVHLARLEDELKSARQMQIGMVPATFPEPTTERPVEIFAMIEPAREIGGDLYDFYEAGDGKLCFIIGDVSGKGIPSALFMARTKNLIRLVTRLARSVDGRMLQPAEIMTLVNQELCQDNTEMMFVTLFFGILNLSSGEVRFTNAGHSHPYHLHGTIVEAVMSHKGHPLGVRVNSKYETGSLALVAGDVLYLYTDGITEALDRNGQLFSENRLEAVLRNAAGSRPAETVNAVTEAVRQFVGEEPRADDITALAIRRIGSSPR